jgi:hypothetical protein
VSEPVPGSNQPEPPTPAEPAKPGVYVPKWVAAVVAVVVIGLGGFVVGKATSKDDSNARPAGFSQQGQSGAGQPPQGGFGQQGGLSGGQSSSGQSGSPQGGSGQTGPMTRSGGS